MEWVFTEIDYKSANPNIFKGAPNAYERHGNEDPYAIKVGRQIKPGVAASPPQKGIPMRGSWAAGGSYSHECGTWYTGDAPMPEGPVTKYASYAWQHTQFVRATN